MANTALGGGVNADGIKEHPRLGLKTQEQGGAKVDSAGAKILGKDALPLPLPPSMCLPSSLPSPIYCWTGRKSGSGFSDRPREPLAVFASLDRF